MKKNIELLAPVGSIESLYAAIQNGANAVYLGGKLFNARHYASNFEEEELREAIKYAHLRNVKVYITVNILLDDSEINDAIDYVRFLYEIDVDAIIVQDLGFANLIRKLLPKLDLHGSTQMTIHNLSGTEFLRDMGFSRVVLSRETPISEIKHIGESADIELEAFVHGALCMSYSGQCLMSSMIGGRSGNRGMCAQPCRMKYSIMDADGKLLKDWDKVHALSPKDLNTLDYLDELIDSGITSLKIEGRMKRPEYVATVVNAYRNAIDTGTSDDEKRDVEQIFSRGFTKGLTFGDFGNDFVTPDRPDNRGLFLGKVIRVDKYKVYIKLEEDIEQGDGIEFLLMNGQYRGIKIPFDTKKGTTIHLEKPGNIEKDTDVYKTSSQRLLIKAKESYTNSDIKYPIDMQIDIKIGEKPRLLLIYKDKVIDVCGDKAVERSQKISISREKVKEQLSKLGDTTYELNSLQINIEEGSFLPVSVLNQLRRDAVQVLEDRLKIFNSRDILNHKEFNEQKNSYKFVNKEVNLKKRLHIKVGNINQLNKLDLDKVDRVYIGFNSGLGEAVRLLKSHNKEAYYFTDKIMYEKDLKNAEEVVKSVEGLDGISVSNLGTLKYFKDRFDIDIHGDIGLNAFNSYTIDYLKSINISSITLSPELNLSQIRKITDKVGGNLEALAYGYVPVMVMKNCPMALVKGCKNDNNCKSCNFSKGYGLKDRMGVTFKMYRDEGFTTLYNSVPLMVLDSLEAITNAGVDIIRLDFTNEMEIRDLQIVFYNYLNKNIDINQVNRFMEEFKQESFITNGHYFRGIL